MWPLAYTNMLAKRHQYTIYLNPVLSRESGLKCRYGLFRGLSLNVTPAIGDTMNVNIHTDQRNATGNAQCEISTFRPDPSKREQDLPITGELTTIFRDCPLGDLIDLFGFAFGKGTRLDQLANLRDRQLANGLGCAGQGK